MMKSHIFCRTYLKTVVQKENISRVKDVFKKSSYWKIFKELCEKYFHQNLFLGKIVSVEATPLPFWELVEIYRASKRRCLEMLLISFVFVFFPLCLFDCQTIAETDNSDNPSKLVLSNFEKKSTVTNKLFKYIKESWIENFIFCMIKVWMKFILEGIFWSNISGSYFIFFSNLFGLTLKNSQFVPRKIP